MKSKTFKYLIKLETRNNRARAFITTAASYLVHPGELLLQGPGPAVPVEGVGVHGVGGGGEGGGGVAQLLLRGGLLLQVALRVVAVLLGLRGHALGLHAQLLEGALQLVVLLPQLPDNTSIYIIISLYIYYRH